MVTTRREPASQATPVLFSTRLLNFLANQDGIPRVRQEQRPIEDEVVKSNTSYSPAANSNHSTHKDIVECHEAKVERKPEQSLEQEINSSLQQFPELRTADDHSKLMWPALAVTTVAGLALYATRRSSGTQKLSIKTLASRPIPTTTRLLYTSLAANVICSGALLYTFQQQRSTSLQSQLDTVNAWEMSAEKNAKSRIIAMQQNFEDHQESLREQHSSIQRDVHQHWHELQASHAAAIASISTSQTTTIRSIKKAEDSAWKANRVVEAALHGVNSRLAKVEAEIVSSNGKLKDTESKLESGDILLGQKLREVERRLGTEYASLDKRVEDCERRLNAIVRQSTASMGRSKHKQD